MAVRAFEYRGAAVTPADVCVVTPTEAAALVYQRQARWPGPSEALGIYQQQDLARKTSRRATGRTSQRRDAATDA